MFCNRRRKILKSVKAKKYQVREKNDQEKVQNFTRIVALISGHPVQKSIAIHFHVLWDLFIKFICIFGGIWQL